MAPLCSTCFNSVGIHLYHSKAFPQLVKGNYCSISSQTRIKALSGYTANCFKSKSSLLTTHPIERRTVIASSSVVRAAVVRSNLDQAKRVVISRKRVWEDTLFTPDDQVQETYGEAVEKLREQVRRMLVDKESKLEDKMILIDTLERLGVAYHFNHEIEDQIQQIYQLQEQDLINESSYDLLTTALHFRLFRQHGFDAPSSVFNKYKDDVSGGFKEILGDDIRGLLSLYDATHVRYQGEDILTEGYAFASRCMKLAKPLLNAHLQQHVNHALRQPAHWGNPRIEAHYYISFYEKEESKNELLLEFAKLDFNLVQNLYKQEITILLKWWNNLNLTSRLPYLRDRTVEGFFWVMTMLPAPRHSLARICATKNFMVAILMNDTYDSSEATYEETKTFLEIIQQGWDSEEIDKLPYYLQIAHKAILSTYEDFDREISKPSNAYAVLYTKQAFQNVAGRWIKRCTWYNEIETPTFDEIICDGFVDIAGECVSASCLMGMEPASKEAFEWLMSRPAIAEASGLYARLRNDIATYEREREDNQLLGTPVYWYMKEQGVLIEEAMAKLGELAEDALMTINKEWVSKNCVSTEIMKMVVNFARAAYVSYLEGIDGYTEPDTARELKKDMEAIFIHPIEINNFPVNEGKK